MSTAIDSDSHLAPGTANYATLTPLSFLARAAAVAADKTAVVHGETAFTYADFYARVRRFASALTARGISEGDVVSVMAPNVPALLEAHYAVPMVGAILNPLNYRLDAKTIAFILEHAESKLLITDTEFSATIGEALTAMDAPPEVIDIDDPLFDGERKGLGDTDYEGFLAEGDPAFAWAPPEDEWQSICLLYTSGTTGNPKGVLYHHRGAYLNALGNALAFGLSPESVYLWTLPMFHCCGWTYTWAVTAVCATHVCLRRVEPDLIFPAIRAQRVTHMCGAPIVLTMLIHAPDDVDRRFDHLVDIATGGAAPAPAVIAAMEDMGFRVTHLYGLTECYGPSTMCRPKPEWTELGLADRSGLMARQGIAHSTVEAVMVADPDTADPVPPDGETMGEIMLRGNTVMKGYLKNPTATAEAFAGGWFRTGDLGVQYPDGYMQVKDRSKDVIISGGENISSLEVEDVLYAHPNIMEAAVVAKPDPKWGETPCAFVTLNPGAEVAAEEIIAFCRDNMARFKVPKTIVFGPLPKTSTGKIQKFMLRERAAEMA